MEPVSNMDKGLTSRISNLLLIVFVVIIILLSAIKLLFPAENYREQITQRLTEYAGQPIQIDGSLEWYLSPFPSMFITSIVAHNSEVSLRNVSISFSLLDLIQLKPAPSSIEIESVISISHQKIMPLLEQANIGFDTSAGHPNTFEFAVNHSALSGNKAHNQSLSHLSLKVQGEIQHLAAGGYHVAGKLLNTDTAKPQSHFLPEETTLELALAIGEHPNTHLFDLSLSNGAFELFASGALSILQPEISITIDTLKTPNMTLSGKSIWQREDALLKTTLQSDHITVPETCFKTANRSNITHCYDLAMLLMLPGTNSLHAKALKIHQQRLNDLHLDWTFVNGEIVVQKADASAVGGTLSADGRFTLATNSWELDLQGKNLAVEALLQAVGRETQLYGNSTINLKASGQFEGLKLIQHKIDGKVIITNGKTSLFNLEKELCSQVKGVVVTNTTSTSFDRLDISLDEENHHLKIPYFVSELDGATISGQGEVSQAQTVDLVMNVKLDKEEWSLCKLPRALTGIEWPLTCHKPADSKGNCSINVQQMGLNALLLAEDPELKDKTKQHVKTLKSSDKVKKVLGRLEKWLDE